MAVSGRAGLVSAALPAPELAELGPVLPTAYVFRTRSGGPIEPRNFTRAFKVAAERAGLPKTTRLYDLRHSCASLLLAAGEHPRVVAELLGHSTTKLTMDTYSHVLPALARSAADRIDALLAGEVRPS